MRWRGAILGVLAALPQGLLAASIAGLDHMPVVVRDLARAQVSFTGLGFAIEPGRPQANGLRTALVKFPDGSGLELVAAPNPVDPLTTQYAALMLQGEGPAFFALHVRDIDQLREALRVAQLPYDVTNGIRRVALPGLEWLFFVDDDRSPTDRPEHFAHPNGATAMSRVWVAPDDPEPLRRVLRALGARIERRRVAAPDPADAEVAQLDNGELVILPKDHQLVPGRAVIGATFTASAAAAPRRIHGLWVEFRRR